MKLIKDLGIKYPTETSKHKTRYGLYECPVCLKHFEVMTGNVKSGNSTKCGSCATTIKNVTHGDARTKLYMVWCAMKARCYRTNDKSYKNYGGRGITVCTEWREDYSAFKKWAVDSGYDERLSIDRIDNDGDYEPSNCRWATPKTQARNKRRIMSTNTTGYRCVQKLKKQKKYMAHITVNYKRIIIGVFETAEEAAQAYDAYVIKHSLEHTLNFQRSA